MSKLCIGEQSLQADVLPADGGFSLQVEGRRIPVRTEAHPDGSFTLLVEGKRHRCVVVGSEVWVDGRVRRVTVEQKAAGRLEVNRESSRSGTPGTPPMPGVVTRVHVSVGSAVEAGDPMVAITAMKMEQTIRVPKAGTVKAVRVTVGESVKAGQTLVEIE